MATPFRKAFIQHKLVLVDSFHHSELSV